MILSDDSIDGIRRAFGSSAPRRRKDDGDRPRRGKPKAPRRDLPALMSHPSFVGGLTAEQEASLRHQAERDSAEAVRLLQIPEAMAETHPALTVHAVRRVLACDVFRAKVAVEYLQGTLFTSKGN